MRKIRVFEKQAYTSIDLLNKEVLEYSAKGNIETDELTFNNQKMDVHNHDALATELTSFCHAIQNKNYEPSNITAAIEALDIAIQINKIIHEKRN